MVERFIDYINLEKKYSKHTVQAYKKDIETFQVFSNSEYGESDIVKSSYGEIRSWIVALVNSGVSNRTVNRKISALNSFYKYLQRIEEVQTNPLSGHKALKVAKRLQVPFSESEVVSVIEGIELDGFASLRDKLLVEL